MENNNLKKCKFCTSEVPKEAKVCPKCGKDLRNWFIRHYIITAFLVILVIGSIGTSIDKGKDEETINNAIGEQKSNSSEVKIEEAIKISSIELTNEYKENEIKADEKYRNKILEVSGTISSIDKVWDTPYIRLEGGEMFWNVSCKLKDSTQGSEVNKGDKITVVGKNIGNTISSITLDLCKLK